MLRARISRRRQEWTTEHTEHTEGRSVDLSRARGIGHGVVLSRIVSVCSVCSVVKLFVIPRGCGPAALGLLDIGVPAIRELRGELPE